MLFASLLEAGGRGLLDVFRLCGTRFAWISCRTGVMVRLDPPSRHPLRGRIGVGPMHQAESRNDKPRRAGRLQPWLLQADWRRADVLACLGVNLVGPEIFLFCLGRALTGSWRVQWRTQMECRNRRGISYCCQRPVPLLKGPVRLHVNGCPDWFACQWPFFQDLHQAAGVVQGGRLGRHLQPGAWGHLSLRPTAAAAQERYINNQEDCLPVGSRWTIRFTARGASWLREAGHLEIVPDKRGGAPWARFRGRLFVGVVNLPHSQEEMYRCFRVEAGTP